MKLVVIMPALNEQATIARVIQDIPREIPGIDDIQVIVVDDGSTDQTSELARGQGADVIRHGKNRGVGAAFKTGIEGALAAGADLIVNMDSDGQFDPKTIPELIRPIMDGEVEFVTCTRFAKKELLPQMPLIKRWGNSWVAMIVNFLTRKNFTDVACGFRAYSRECAMRLNLFGSFTYTQETFLDLVRKNVSMTEVPLPVRGEREFGKSRVASSIPLYAYRASSIILLTMRDTKPLAFFGIIGLLTIFGGSLAGAFVFGHWLITGLTSPYQSMINLSTMLLILGFLLIIMALIADMLGRIRTNQDEMLYLERQQLYGPARENNPKP